MKKRLLTALAAFFMAFFIGQGMTQASTLPVLDLSEWQGTITANQAKLLKGEVKGVILRVQYGSNYADKTFVHNVKVLKTAGVKYGVYSFSQYVSASDAKQEAKDFYNRAKAYAPQFYVNDAETNTVTSGTYVAATKAWATEMQSLTGKKVYLYSYRSFYTTNIKTKSGYDGFWLAAYQSSTPSGADYQLWQYSDSLYNTALKQSTDASKFIGTNNWFGDTIDKSKYPNGGHVLGEVVRVKVGTKFYGTKTKIATALTNIDLRVRAIKTIYTGTSSQVLTIYNGKTVIGQIRAQDVRTAYYSNPDIKKVKVIKSNGIWTYKNGKAQNHISKGTVLNVSGYTTWNGYRRFVHAGHGTNITSNKANIKVVK